ncbi:unnamed protein product [Larinioides sclopetarius]|uniref:Uncharacterized protein n=1 Tax=Larinioides sclopetarius TaxID=280406 RepID=A0AAV2ATU6_9ARAC
MFVFSSYSFFFWFVSTLSRTSTTFSFYGLKYSAVTPAFFPDSNFGF